jgi:hypothetical protein
VKENKNENKNDYNKEVYNKEVNDKKSKEKRFSSTKETLKGIGEEVIQTHKATNAICWRCSHSNHYPTECYAKTADSSKRLKILTINLQRKRQRSNEENEIEVENTNTKKDKTAEGGVALEIAAERWIGEIDTETQKDF